MVAERDPGGSRAMAHWTETVEGKVAHYLENPHTVAILVYTEHHDELGVIPGRVLNFAHVTGLFGPDGYVASVNAQHAKGKLPYRVVVDRVVTRTPAAMLALDHLVSA